MNRKIHLIDERLHWNKKAAPVKARVQWPDKVVADLLDIYSETKIQTAFTSGKQSHAVVWKVVCKRLLERHPEFPATHLNCRDKWKTRKSRYTDLKKGAGASGSANKQEEYVAILPQYKKLDELLSTRQTTNPIMLVSSVGGKDLGEPSTGCGAKRKQPG